MPIGLVPASAVESEGALDTGSEPLSPEFAGCKEALEFDSGPG